MGNTRKPHANQRRKHVNPHPGFFESIYQWFKGGKDKKEPFVEIFDQPEPAPIWPNPPSKNSINTNV